MTSHVSVPDSICQVTKVQAIRVAIPHQKSSKKRPNSFYSSFHCGLSVDHHCGRMNHLRSVQNIGLWWSPITIWRVAKSPNSSSINRGLAAATTCLCHLVIPHLPPEAFLWRHWRYAEFHGNCGKSAYNGNDGNTNQQNFHRLETQVPYENLWE